MEQNQFRDDEIQINLREVFGLLLSKAGVIILTGIICGLIAVIGTKIFITPQYQSVTKMYVLAKQSGETVTNSDLQTSTLLTKDYAELIKSRTVTEAVITELGLNLTHEEMLNKLEIGNTADTRIVTIKVTDPDPYMARDIANAVRDAAASHIQTVMNTEAVNVVDEANIPDGKSSPSVGKNGMLAGMLGCIIAIAVILIVHFTNDSIKTSEDVERYLGLSTLGTIPMTKAESKKRKKKSAYKRR